MENAGKGSAQRLLARALERNTLRLLRHLTFEFKKRRQLFIRTHNKALTVATVRVSNPDRSPARVRAAETQPQLHSRLLRLSAMISQYFILPGCFTDC